MVVYQQLLQGRDLRSAAWRATRVLTESQTFVITATTFLLQSSFGLVFTRGVTCFIMSLLTSCAMLRRLNLFWTKAICISAASWGQTAE
eukprot:2162216-Karenia_brevis.AAC.1